MPEENMQSDEFKVLPVVVVINKCTVLPVAAKVKKCTVLPVAAKVKKCAVLLVAAEDKKCTVLPVAALVFKIHNVTCGNTEKSPDQLLQND